MVKHPEIQQLTTNELKRQAKEASALLNEKAKRKKVTQQKKIEVAIEKEKLIPKKLKEKVELKNKFIPDFTINKGLKVKDKTNKIIVSSIESEMPKILKEKVELNNKFITNFSANKRLKIIENMKKIIVTPTEFQNPKEQAMNNDQQKKERVDEVLEKIISTPAEFQNPKEAVEMLSIKPEQEITNVETKFDIIKEANIVSGQGIENLIPEDKNKVTSNEIKNFTDIVLANVIKNNPNQQVNITERVIAKDLDPKKASLNSILERKSYKFVDTSKKNPTNEELNKSIKNALKQKAEKVEVSLAQKPKTFVNTLKK